jgi:hypothetical protein
MDQEAVNRLKQALPHIRMAIEMAKLQEPQGEITLAICSKKPDGSGQLTAHFEGEFLDDVARVLGVFDKPGWEVEDGCDD